MPLPSFGRIFFSRRAQIEQQLPVLKPLQPTFKVPVIIHRFARHQLHAMSAKAFKVCRLRQLPVKSRRRNLKHIRSARYGIFYVDDGSELATERRTIFVRHTVRMIRRRSCSGPVDKHAQGPVFARTEQNSRSPNLKPARTRHPLRNLAEACPYQKPCFQRLTSGISAPNPSPTKKWAFAHWCASTILTLRHNSIH